jgi:hypothetical protein
LNYPAAAQDLSIPVREDEATQILSPFYFYTFTEHFERKHHGTVPVLDTCTGIEKVTFKIDVVERYVIIKNCGCD